MCSSSKIILALLAVSTFISTAARSDEIQPVELHVWGMNLGDPRMGLYAAVDEFERRYPNVRVILGPTDRGQDLQKLLCGIVGNSPPDVFRREAQLFGDIASRNILLPLDPFIESDKNRPDGLHEVDYIPGVWQAGKGLDGRVYGIHEASNPLVLVYNKQLFREAGLDPDSPPRTWNEWIDATRALTRFDQNGRIEVLGTLFHIRDDLVFYMTQLGAPLFSTDGRQCLLDSPEGLRATEFMVDMFDAIGGFESAIKFAQTNQNAPGSFAIGTGKLAMTVEDDWAIARAMTYAPHIDLGIAPVPAPEGHAPITTSATNPVYMIPYNARQPELAWAFIRFMNSPDGQRVFYRGLAESLPEPNAAALYPGFRPNRKTLAALSAIYAPKEEPYKGAYARVTSILETLQPAPSSPVSALLWDEARRVVDRSALGETTPNAALAESDRRIQEQLDLHRARLEYPLFPWWPVWLTLAITLGAAAAFIRRRTQHERARTSLQRYENRMGFLFISPWLLGFIVFTAGPMVFSLAISLCDYNVIDPARYVGLQNYQFLLTKDPLFWKSLGNTAFMVLALPLNMALALGIALLLNANVKGMSVYRTVFYLPAITPAIASAVLWYALLNPDGVVNEALRTLGLDPPSWLGDPDWSKPAIVLMGLWGAGGGMILWLAGLQGIPPQLYEAASIDGAGPTRQFFAITMPMLTPYIFFTFVTGIIGIFQIFAQALVMTRGGPADSTLFYVYYLFNNAFRYFKMGYASSMAWILFVLVLTLTLVQWKLAKRWVHYG